MSIRVLIVDDSALVRSTLTELLDAEPDIEVIGTAADPYAAARRIRQRVPDVILLDIEMPRMDGLTFLERLMAQHPLPVVICSAHAQAGAEATLRALEYGAVDVIAKPRLATKRFLSESRVRIGDAVRAAAAARLDRAPRLLLGEESRLAPAPKLLADAVLPPPPTRRARAGAAAEPVIVAAASTGGTSALRVFLSGMPEDCPGIVVVQHMPEYFTHDFAARLDSLCAIDVKEAEDGDALRRGAALIAPGNVHVLLERSRGAYRVRTEEGPLVCRHRPSADVLFRSAAIVAGAAAIGILMTGMGDDGARGLRELRDAGARTIAQDEETSVVFGMPAQAIERGGAEFVLPLPSIAPHVGALLAERAGER